MKRRLLSPTNVVAVLLLAAANVAIAEPVAVATATPNPALPGQLVQFDGSSSHDTNPTLTIDSWEWDFNSDGVYEVSGPFPTRSFPLIGDYLVALRVSNNNTNPEEFDTDTLNVRIRNDTTVVSEPGTVGLLSLGLGLAVFGASRGRKQ